MYLLPGVLTVRTYSSQLLVMFDVSHPAANKMVLALRTITYNGLAEISGLSPISRRETLFQLRITP
jgi:hypothetical protein